MYDFRFLICLGLIFFSFPNCMAGENTSLASLPQEASFINSRNQTTLVLKALLFENKQMYRKANRIWGVLPEQVSLVKEHRFITGFASPDNYRYENLPVTEQSILMMVRYLTWQKEWERALSILENNREIVDNSVDGQLELIHLYLCLGKYDDAEKLVTEVTPSDRRALMHLKILIIWLEILNGNKTGVFDQIQQVEENFLYLPTSSILPPGLSKDGNQRKESAGKSLLRFPSNQTLLEELILLHLQTENWMEVQYLVQSQKYISNQPFSWLLLAELYTNNGQAGELKQILESRKELPAEPEFYDYLARSAIAEENWQVLGHVAEVYDQTFPDLLDGQIYKAIYYEKTGQLEKSKALFDEAGL